MYMKNCAGRPLLRLKPLAACLVPLLALAVPALASDDSTTMGMPHFAAAARQRAADVGRMALVGQSRLPPRTRAAQPPHATAAQLMSTPVTNCDDSGGADSLRAAILSAGPGETIDLTNLACSKITLQGGPLEVGLDDLKIEGPGAGALTIDGNQADRVFKHTGAGTLTLTGLTIANGTYSAGAALGGCIYSAGSLELIRSTLTSCQAIGQTVAAGGGAAALYDITLDSSVVSGNLADAVTGQAGPAAIAGGLLAKGQGKGLTLLHSVVSGNTVHAASGSASGGGVVGNAVTVKYSTLTGNKAISIGDVQDYSAAGAIDSLYSLSMTNSTVDHNEADIGGGILVTSGFATIVQSTISNNTANLAAGGIAAIAPFSMANSTVAFNKGGPLGGGGVAVNGTFNATLQSSIMASNSPSDFDGGAVVSGTNNLIRLVGPNSAMLPMGTITSDPMLAPLAHNGGTTRTHAIGAGSPAIDAGSNVANLMLDQRAGNFARKVGAEVDIGAFEFDPDRIFVDRFDEL